jgi:putative Holliday junction resolvase
MGRILAIDFGKKNIGLAVSDETKTIASGLDGFHYNSKKEVIEKLKTVIREKEIEKIVLGYPISMSGKITQIGLLVLNFKKLLEEKFALPVELLDERFTTEIARQTIQQVKRKSIPPKSLIDKVSSTIILQDYLSQQNKE